MVFSHKFLLVLTFLLSQILSVSSGFERFHSKSQEENHSIQSIYSGTIRPAIKT